MQALLGVMEGLMDNKEDKMAKTKELPVNKDVLKWARETAGLSIPQVSQELGVKAEFILEIEHGHTVSKTLLNELSRLYKRPLAVLFLPGPPDESKIPTDYRLLPNQKQVIGPETAHALREARQFQEVLSDLTENPNTVSVFQNWAVKYNDNPADIGSKIRKIIGIEFAEQKNWRDPGYAFRAWRGKLQTLGINVFVADFPREEARGFSLWHKEFIPIIVVSRNEAPVAQSFTLFHELAHILLRSEAMCLKKEDETLLGSIEAWCNRVAASTLVPKDKFRDALAKYGYTDVESWKIDDLFKIASIFKVSRHVIAIRAEQIGLANAGYYNRIKGFLDMDDFPIAKIRPSETEDYKRDIPRERLTEVGFVPTTTILEACRKSVLSTIEAADLLKVRPTKFQRLYDLASAQSAKYG